MATYYRTDGWVKAVLGTAIAGAQVYICAQPANTVWIPPTPLANIYSDSQGLSPITQPIVTDGFGHYDFYAAPGVYTVVVVNAGKVQQVYPDQSVGNVGSTGGSSIVFETNGVVNAQQLVQNLVQGSGATISTDSLGNTTISSLPDFDSIAVVVSSDQLIPNTAGSILITKPSQAHLTLNPPVAGTQPAGDDGKSIRLVAVTSFAHVITTNTVPYNNGTKYVLTLVPPSYGYLIAYGGVWYVVTNNAGTLS